MPLPTFEEPIKIAPPKPYAISKPNVPEPLHQVAPRNFMTAKEWKEIRDKVKKECRAEDGELRCQACGNYVPHVKGNYIECHELYKINYKKYTATFKEFVGLCSTCHKFIHSGFLRRLWKEGGITEERYINVLQSGIGLAKTYDLAVNELTLKAAEEMYINTDGVRKLKAISIEALPTKERNKQWGNWKMLYYGETYPPKYTKYSLWKTAMGIEHSLDS